MTDMGSSPFKSKFKGSFAKNTDINISLIRGISVAHGPWLLPLSASEHVYSNRIDILAGRLSYWGIVAGLEARWFQKQEETKREKE